MRLLDERVWAEHYPQLRAAVLDTFPRVDRQELEAIRDDYDGLVEVVQRGTGLSAEVVRQRLAVLDVDELGLGVRQGAERDTTRASLALLELGNGFHESDRARIVDRFSKLDRRLSRFPAEGTTLELSVKDRDAPSQSVTLVCSPPRYAPFVATSNLPDLQAALADVRDDLWRQIDDAVTKRTEGYK